MTLEKEEVLAKFNRLSGLEDFDVAKRLLSSCDSTLVPFPLLGEGKVHIPSTARSILPTWRARVENATRNGHNFPGGKHLVAALAGLAEDTEVFSVIFKDDVSGVGQFYFQQQTGEPVGFIIAKAPKGAGWAAFRLATLG